MQEVIIATGNPHKVEELRAIFAAHGIPVAGLRDLGGNFPEPDEPGATFEENAAIKALAYARATGRLCLADDSGLDVDALEGAPGVISSHYATAGHETGVSRPERDRANNEKLLRDLDGIPRDRRTARFVCVMCLAGYLATPLRKSDSATSAEPLVLATTRGTFEGRIGLPEEDIPRGQHGFGYDPLFILEDRRTSAELSPDDKNARSHRAAAARAMAREIARLISPRTSP